MVIVEISGHGFLARTTSALDIGARCSLAVELAEGVLSHTQAEVVRQAKSDAGQFYGFRIENPDNAWRRCVAWLDAADQLTASVSVNVDANPTATAVPQTAAMHSGREPLVMRAQECV